MHTYKHTYVLTYILTRVHMYPYLLTLKFVEYLDQTYMLKMLSHKSVANPVFVYARGQNFLLSCGQDTRFNILVNVT